jgi:hypothetical protein
MGKMVHFTVAELHSEMVFLFLPALIKRPIVAILIFQLSNCRQMASAGFMQLTLGGAFLISHTVLLRTHWVI